MGLLKNTPLRKQKEKLQTGNSFTNHISDKKISIVCTQNILRTLLAQQHRKTTQLYTGQRIFNTSLKKIQFSSVAQLCPTLCNPMNRSTPGLPVHHQLPEFTQTHIHRVSDAIQTSHPLSSPCPPAPSPSQHQGLFQ